MSGMTPEKATALRKPFPKESIGKLPKGGVQLDYVGHAAVTDRLLTVDPEWSWDFLAYTPDGIPVTKDSEGNLWIRLTICGVSRIGVGDGKSAKERIGDAIRNAAMRFGVALDLWAKEDLVEFAQAAQAHHQTPAPAKAPPAEPPPTYEAQRPGDVDGGDPMSDKTRARMFAMFTERGITDREQQVAGIAHVIGRPIASRSELTEDEARAVIDRLKQTPATTGESE